MKTTDSALKGSDIRRWSEGFDESRTENLQPAAPKGEFSGLYNLPWSIVDARCLLANEVRTCTAVYVCFALDFSWKAMDPVELKRCK